MTNRPNRSHENQHCATGSPTQLIANSQTEFATNSQSCELHREFAANLQSQRNLQRIRRIGTNWLQIHIPTTRTLTTSPTKEPKRPTKGRKPLSTDSASKIDRVDPDESHNNPQYADTQDSDDSGELNKDQNKAIEHAHMNSSSNKDHVDPNESYNNPQLADTHGCDDSRVTDTDGKTTPPSLEVDTDSSLQRRFRDSHSDNPINSAPALSHLSDWKPIKDDQRR